MCWVGQHQEWMRDQACRNDLHQGRLRRRFLAATEPLLGGGDGAVRRVLAAEACAAEAQRALAAARIAGDEAVRCGFSNEQANIQVFRHLPTRQGSTAIES